MTFAFRIVFLWFLCLGSATAVPVIAQDAASAETADEASDRFREEASKYQFSYLDGDKPLTQQPQPLLHWSNPARGGEDGMVFLWTDGNKPCVIGTCFTYVYRDRVHRKHAFHVLTNEAIQGKNEGRILWSPPKGAVKYHPIADAPPPALTPAQRNGQLRLLARRFGVELTLKNGRKEQCRLVPQPLYRFDSGEADEPTGAIFSFAVGTDPEALLILDRRKDGAGNPRWHYAIVRFTFYPLEGFLDQQSVWKLEQSENLLTSIFSRSDYQRQPYITFRAEWLGQ